MHGFSADAEPKAEAAIGTLYLGKKAVVLGAGPGGATAAMFLARHGFTVEVYDKRPEPKDDAVDEGRSYVIILIPRGQAALQQLGVALPTAPQFRTLGSVRRDKKGRVQVVKEEGNLIFSRSTLAQFLIDQAKAKFPGAITFRFGVEAQSIDVDGQQVVFNMRSASGSDGGGGGGSSGNGGGFAPFAAQYDLLVGADGVGSIVRSALAKALPGFTTEVSDSGREYKVYGGLKAVDGIEPPEFAGRTGATLHLWSSGAHHWHPAAMHGACAG